MFQSTLIVGGDEQQRKTLVEQMLNQEHIASYDRVTVSIEEGSTSIKIEQARVLIRALTIPPVNSPWKVGIIREFQFATVETQNALLKLLEEPPHLARIVMTVDAADKLLPTIVSRCHIVNIKYQISTMKYEETDKQVNTLNRLLNSSKAERFALAGTVGEDRQSARAFLKEIILAARMVIVSQYTEEKISNFKFSSEARSRFAGQISNLNLIRTCSRALSTIENTNTNPRLLMENLLLNT